MKIRDIPFHAIYDAYVFCLAIGCIAWSIVKLAEILR